VTGWEVKAIGRLYVWHARCLLIVPLMLCLTVSRGAVTDPKLPHASQHEKEKPLDKPLIYRGV